MLRLKEAIVCSLFLCILIQRISACPPADVIQPCKCENATEDTPDFKLDCSGFLTTTNLSSALDKMQDYKLVALKVEKSAMQYMPQNLLTLRGQMEITLNEMSLISLLAKYVGETVDVESSATSFYMNKNKFTRGFSLSDLHPFKNLEFIHFANTKIRYPICANYSFTPTLEKLYLIDVGLHKFDDDCFSYWPKLTELYFWWNHIKEIKGTMFPPNLEYVDFSHNKISHLPDDIFAHTPHLGRIVFMSNFLTHLSEEVLLPTSVWVIWMSDNPFECDCKMTWLLKKKPKNYIKLFDDDTECGGPAELKGKPFSKLTDQDFYHCQ